MSAAITHKPLGRPYPFHARQATRGELKAQGHRDATIRIAEGTNTPLWQHTIARHLTPQELVAAEQNGAAIIAAAAQRLKP